MSASVSLQPLQGDSYPGANPIDDWATLEGPSVSLLATGQPGDLDKAELTVPTMQLSAHGGGTASITVPGRSYSLSGTVVNIGRVDVALSLQSMSGSGLHGGIGSATLSGIGRSVDAFSGAVAEIERSGYELTAGATTGGTGTALLYLPCKSIEATGTAQNYGTAELAVPGHDSLWGTARDLEAPGFSIFASGQEVLTPIYAAYAVNTSNAAVTTYSNYEFDFIIRYEGRYYGCGANGIMLLEGPNDSGTNIAAKFELHPTDFDTDVQKRLTYAYLGARMGATDQMRVGVSPDEDTYRDTLTTKQHRNRRAKFPRGLKGRYWSLRAENVGGNALDVDTIRIVTENLKRRL